MRAATTPAAHGEAFNLGTGIQTTIKALARIIIDASVSRSEIQFAILLMGISGYTPWNCRKIDHRRGERILYML